jgi:hypothetical protein
MQEAEVITDLPGINEPGADHQLTRMLHYARGIKAQYEQEASSAQGENMRHFAREMAGEMQDQIIEIKNRINVLLKHYQTKLMELEEAYESLPLEDYPDIQRVETRIRLRLNHLEHALAHA